MPRSRGFDRLHHRIGLAGAEDVSQGDRPEGTPADADGSRLREDLLRLRGLLADCERRLARAHAAARRERVRAREAEHRIGNSLQVLGSLLRLQATRALGAEAQDALRTAAGRLDAIAQVHARLQADPGRERVDFAEFLRGLCDRLGEALGVDGERRAVVVEAEPTELPAAAAGRLALVVNELVTNAVRHAFPEDRPGTVWVQLRNEGDRIGLTIADDGDGLPLGAEDGLGLQLVAAVAEELNARLDVDRVGGTRVRISLRSPAPPGARPVRDHEG